MQALLYYNSPLIAELATKWLVDGWFMLHGYVEQMESLLTMIDGGRQPNISETCTT